ncbi:hypothetical protein NVV94_24395 [Pseudomonas sp. LS1212]|uniref:hypothetical protein n=1 Tax=Pseudomonas sp. LS1212 TaxID=2972478 RepID=UPI00215BCC30|nr:hypothetical protein [Pseudomonas sp. LS1212]UVJ43640.1 hypothetical protein NVV94_24395 [Pseudomonas sp. LS1212]
MEEIGPEELLAQEESAKGLAALMKTLDAIDGDIEFGYADFIKICVGEDESEDDFLGFFEIDPKEGLKRQELSDDIRSSLTRAERNFLGKHPSNNLSKPVLPFPFTMAEFKKVIRWSIGQGVEIPIDQDGLAEVIAEKMHEQQELQKIDSEQRERNSQEGVDQNLPVLDQRIEHLRRWFKGQGEFTATNLRSAQSGTVGARHACWEWVVQQGLTSPGGLFDGANQGKSTKTKPFVEAWGRLLVEVAK